MPVKYRVSKRALAESYVIIFIVGLAMGYAAFSWKQITPEIAIEQSQLPEHLTASSVIVAVRSDGAGAIGSVDVEINPGKGRVLINTNPFVEPDTQFSAETAVNVAAKFAKVDLTDRDVIFSFNVNGTLIGGPSAGAAMTIAAIAAIEWKEVASDAAITGTIEDDSAIGAVGGIIEKAQAAGESGIKLFLVPKGQAKGTYYEREVKEERMGGFVFRRINYVPKTFDLNNFTQEQFGMESHEVAEISEAVGYMIK